MAMLEVRLLGKFEVKYEQKPIDIVSRPAQSLFAYLILSAGTSHRREKLAGLLWPDSLEETARDNLRHALWRVRKALPSDPKVEYLLTDDLTIAFNNSVNYWLDAAEFEKLSEDASADELIAVLSEYHGELLPGFHDEWIVLEREHLNSVFEHHMARLMSLLQKEERWPDILDWAERWIKLGQTSEPAYRALMSAHAAQGDMYKVAATYERCVKSLKELGIEPSEQTKKLFEDLKFDIEAPKSVSLAMTVAVRDTSSNIPVPLTSFVGREKELKEIASLLSSSRLLTLTGPGGVGKTRLAIRTASDSIQKFPDGVFWVDLAGLSDANLIPQEIARSLKVRELPMEPMIETLANFLVSRDVLIVLDACEHIIEAAAKCAEQLLAACPKLRILASSRERLGIFSETVWHVPSLPLPELKQNPSLKEIQGFASIQLFITRAGSINSEFSLSDLNARPVAQICNQLDGMPLAIELAAARAEMLTVDQIASRLNNRFSVLTSGSRTAMQRHQTLRATIDWSHDLLTEAERILFRRLAVFAGGFTLEAAEAVCSLGALDGRDVLDLLGRLIDKSLVIVEQATSTGETRYRLLETIHEYALEKLAGIGEESGIRDQHLEFYLNLAETSERFVFGNESVLWFNRLDEELDNLRAAMDFATNTGRAVATLRMAGALVYFWFAHGPLSEWHDRIRRALLLPEGMQRTSARAKALNGIGYLYWVDINPKDRRLELEEALSIGRELDDPWNTATALRNLGLLENIQGNYSQARSLLEQSLEIWHKIGPEWKLESSRILTFLGDVALNLGEEDHARSFYEETAAILREHGDKNFLAYSVRRLGQLACRQGDYEKAIALSKESLSLNQKVGDRRGVMACIASFAAIAVARGRFEHAARLMASVEHQLASIGTRLLQLDKFEYERNLAILRERLDEKSLAACLARGRAITIEQAIASALDET
jgi:predicted ATPase/DNA-binding SARP family transcriptional activator